MYDKYAEDHAITPTETQMTMLGQLSADYPAQVGRFIEKAEKLAQDGDINEYCQKRVKVMRECYDEYSFDKFGLDRERLIGSDSTPKTDSIRPKSAVKPATPAPNRYLQPNGPEKLDLSAYEEQENPDTGLRFGKF